MVSCLLARCWTLATQWTVACQAPLSVGFSRQEYWSGLPFPPPEDLTNPGIKPGSPALQADSLPTEQLNFSRISYVSLTNFSNQDPDGVHEIQPIVWCISLLTLIYNLFLCFLFSPRSASVPQDLWEVCKVIEWYVCECMYVCVSIYVYI